jgi:hypothetical protein
LTWLGETQAALGWGVVLLLGAIVGTLYVSQASRIAATGRTVQLLQLDLGDVKRENALLERAIAEAQSLSRVESRAQAMGFTRAQPDDIEYIVVDAYPTGPAVTPTPAVPPVLVAPAETIWEALWWRFGIAIRNLVEGESSE